MSLGLRRAGFDIRVAVEMDEGSAKTYRANHRKTSVLQCDINDVTGKEILRAAKLRRGGVDLIVGCPPCQGFSRIRRRNGDKAVVDERNDLVLQFARLVREIRPHVVLMENVPGLETDWRFRRLLAVLRGCRYKVEWDVLNAHEYDVPQRRRRLVMIGWRKKARPNLEDIPRRKGGTVRAAIEKLPNLPESAKALRRLRPSYTADVKTRITAVPKNGGSRKGIPSELVLQCHKDDPGFRDVYGRMQWDEPAPTITGGCINPSKGRFLHPRYNRAVSLVEAARLQSFPIWYKFDAELGRYPVAEMIGNALPPNLASRLARYVKDQAL